MRSFAVFLLLAACVAAKAEPMVRFDVAGVVPGPSGSTPISIVFPLPRAPASVDDGGYYFHLDSVDIMHNGVAERWDITFHPLDGENRLFGGLIVFRNVTFQNVVLLNLGGPQLFTGPTSAPEFLTGKFNLRPARSASIYEVPFSVTISEVSAPIPEPESWTLMLAGLGLLGFVARRRKKW